MNYAHLHLLLNHFPIIGTMIGLSLFVASLFGKNGDMKRSSLIILAVMALISIPAFLSGFGAQLRIANERGVSPAWIERHESSAVLAILFMQITGALAILELWQSHRVSHPGRRNTAAILCFSLLTAGLMARTGNTGGDIRHPEDRSGAYGTNPTEGALGSLIHHFEPSPHFADALMAGRWWWLWWWALMALHFLGLALIIGTVGILDLRIMGFLKQLQVAPLHQFIPWGMGGLGINIVTGLLAFIVYPESYIYSSAFWLKMLSLLLLGLNAAAFYLTGAFDGVERLKAGEDAPLSARLIAAASLLLWFLVVAFGRYIQPTAGALPPY